MIGVLQTHGTELETEAAVIGTDHQWHLHTTPLQHNAQEEKSPSPSCVVGGLALYPLKTTPTSLSSQPFISLP